MNLRLFFSSIFIAIFSLISLGENIPKYGKMVPFEKDGKWGIKINNEVMVLPIYDNLEVIKNLNPNDEVFIFTEDGKQGLLTKNHIGAFPIYDKIVDYLNIPGAFIYETPYGKGIRFLEYRKQLINPHTMETLYMEDRPLDIILPGQYKDFILPHEFYKDLDFFAICQTHDDQIRIIYLNDGNDYTPYFDFKKLGGNINKLLKGKIPLRELKINIEHNKLTEYFKKIRAEHKELTKYDAPAPYKGSGLYTVYDDDEVIEHIQIGRFQGVIAQGGYVSIPLQYDKPEEILERDPENKQALMKLSWEKDWQKREMAKAAEKENAQNREDDIYELLNNFAMTLNSIANNMQSSGQGSSYVGNATSKGGKLSVESKYDIREQGNYNLDKTTYSQYDSQLSAHFAGNKPMSETSVKYAQEEMKRIRLKWKERGKNIPQSQNETR